MPELWQALWGKPEWLLGLILVPGIWWLHRFAGAGPRVAVASLSLWRGAAASASAHARQAARADPAWRRRALIAALLIVALAEPFWPGAEPPLTVWVDDSASMFTLENGTARLETLLAQLDSQLDGRREIIFRGLSAPDLRLTQPDMQPALRSQPPAPALMDAHREHWLLTDGASTQVQQWAAAAPLSRIFTSGRTTENSAITALSVRADVGPGNSSAPRWAAQVSVHNGGLNADTRTLEVNAGTQQIASLTLQLPPQSTTTRLFKIAAQGVSLSARLSPGDALAYDDAASLSADALTLPAVALIGACPAAVVSALQAHGGLRLTTQGNADLRVNCDAKAPAAGAPALWFYLDNQVSSPAVAPVWTQSAGELASVPAESLRLRAFTHSVALDTLLLDGELALAGYTVDASRHLLTSLDLQEEALNASPWWPVLFARLLDRVAGRDLLNRSAVAQSVMTANITPRPVTVEATAAAPAASSKPLARWLLALAALIVLLDWLRADKPRAWHASARLLVAALLLVAVIEPPLPFQEPATDFILLLDASHSRATPQRTAGWQAAAAHIARAAAGSRIAVVRFGAAPVLELSWSPVAGSVAQSLLADSLPPTSLAIDSSASDLESALRFALLLAGTGNAAVILVDSDGAWTGDSPRQALSQLNQAGIGVQWLSPPATDFGLSVDTLHVPQEIAEGSALRATAAISKPRGAGRARWLVDDVLQQEQALPETAGFVRLNASLRPAGAGAHTVSLELSQAALAVQRHSLVNVRGAAALLYVGNNATLSAILQATGRPLQTGTPGTLAADLRRNASATVILDDVAPEQFDAAAQRALTEHVTRLGAGLVLLSGPNSLTVDTAPGSPLSALSPVSVSRNKRQPPVAVEFVLDTSGSMAQGPSGASRLELARRALAHSVAQLSDQDSFGLITYAAEPRELVPLARHADPLAALKQSPPAGAGGGSVLAPALQLAIQRLADSPVQHRLLALVTDGFVEAPHLDRLTKAIADAGIDVLALAVGDAPQTATLGALTAINDGRLLTVDDVAQLPRLLPNAVAQHARQPVAGPVSPVPRGQLAADAASRSWPQLAAHAPAELRAGADALLETAAGDPLVAIAQRGAGSVLALTGGLGHWAPQWLAWDALPARLETLLQRIDSQALNTAGGLHARVIQTASGAGLLIDAQTPDGSWRLLDAASASLFAPDEAMQSVALGSVLPGRYQARLPVRAPGRYLLQLDTGGTPFSHGFFHDRGADPAATPDTARALDGLAAEGLINSDSQTAGALQFPAWLAAMLALIALALYLSLLLFCYGPAVAGLLLTIRNPSHATGLQH